MIESFGAARVKRAVRRKAAADCRRLGDVGCWYAPAAVRRKALPELIVYLRGHWNGSGNIPPERRLESSRQAFAFYGLEELARRRQAAVLVTGSSWVGVTHDEIESIERSLSTRFERIVVAVHSGGYVGLEKTLDASVFSRVNRLVMLDNFYFSVDFARRIGGLTAVGLPCIGYYTEHNQERYETRFKPNAECRVEARDDFGHEGAVKRCLARYLDGLPCVAAR